MRSKTLNPDSQEFSSKIFKSQRLCFLNLNRLALKILKVRKKRLFNQLIEQTSKSQFLLRYPQINLSLHFLFLLNLMKRKVRRKPTKYLLKKNKKFSQSQPFHDLVVKYLETLYFITLLLINMSLLSMFHHQLTRLLSLMINYLNDFR